jgi:hypothetical protein
MGFKSPEIDFYKKRIDTLADKLTSFKKDSHSAIYLQKLLNVTIYVEATRFLEASVKHIVHNCCHFRGDDSKKLNKLESSLKKFNNPEFSNIKDIFKKQLNFDIISGKTKLLYTDTDITFLNQIVMNRHRNVHASLDSSEWHNQNTKDLDNFIVEYDGMVNILTYLESITYNSSNKNFED